MDFHLLGHSTMESSMRTEIGDKWTILSDNFMEAEHDDMDQLAPQLEEPSSSSSPTKYSHFKHSGEK